MADFNPLIGFVTASSGGNATAATAAALPPLPPIVPLGTSLGEVSNARRPGTYRTAYATSPAAAPQRGMRPAISTGDHSRSGAPAGEAPSST